MQERIQANPVGSVKKDIYIITNDINNKAYIGQSIDADKRFKEHCKCYTDYVSLINRAINKHGKEHFTYKILEKQISNYNEREKYWIKYYNTMVPNGYNLTDGGEEPPKFYGTDHPNSVLILEQVRNIKEDLKLTRLSYIELAKKYGISKREVLRINHGICYSNIDEQYPIRETPNINGKLTEEDVDLVIEMLKYTYYFTGEIANRFGVKEHAISDINSGKTHFRDDIEYPIRKWKSCGVILFTYEQVTEIIRLLQYSDISLNQIAKEYGVYVQSIQHINDGTAIKYRRDNVEYPIRIFDKPVTTIS